MRRVSLLRDGSLTPCEDNVLLRMTVSDPFRPKIGRFMVARALLNDTVQARSSQEDP